MLHRYNVLIEYVILSFVEDEVEKPQVFITNIAKINKTAAQLI